MLYFDYAATSYPKPLAVGAEMLRVLTEYGGNPGRGDYGLAKETARYLYEARKEAASFFNIRPTSHFIYTLNATESANIVIKGLLQRGDHVVYSSLEHNAVWRPLKARESLGVTLSEIAIPAAHYGDLAAWEAAIRPQTKLFVVNHGSNVTGHVAPLKALCRLAHRYNIRVFSDMAQTAGVLPLDIADLGVDFAAFAGHKSLLGPPGIGGLFVKEEGLLKTLKEGGTGAHSESPKQPTVLPSSLESGTPNMVGVGGLRAGLRLLREETVEAIGRREQELAAQFLQGLAVLPRVTCYGPPSGTQRVPVISINVADLPPQQVSALLEERGKIAVRTGLHCAPLAHKTLGTLLRGTVRFSIGHQTTAADIDTALDVLATI